MTAPRLRPDLPGKVHGIISLEPPTIQCDGCGWTYGHERLWFAVVTSGILFHHRHPGRRLCGDCRKIEWGDDER